MIIQDWRLKLPDYNTVVDFDLVGEGVHISDRYISTIFDGTFYPMHIGTLPVPAEDSGAQAVRGYNYLPYYMNNGRDMQVMLSEYSINVMLKSIIANDWVHVTKSVPLSQLGTVLPDFSHAYGNVRDVTFEITAAPLDRPGYNPSITITKKTVKFVMRVDIHVKNPLSYEVGEPMDAMVLEASVTSSLTFSIDDDFKIKFKANSINVQFVSVKAAYRTTTTKESLNLQLFFINPFVSTFVNTFTAKGINLGDNENVK